MYQPAIEITHQKLGAPNHHKHAQNYYRLPTPFKNNYPKIENSMPENFERLYEPSVGFHTRKMKVKFASLA
jgi:hypothetical protein